MIKVAFVTRFNIITQNPVKEPENWSARMNLNSPALLFFRRGEIMLVHYKRNKRQVFSVHTEKKRLPSKTEENRGLSGGEGGI